jgi:hypothetical protein
MSSSSSSSGLELYHYTKDVENLDLSQLSYEIEQESSITTTLSYIDFDRPDLYIYFLGSLSASEKSALDTVVTNTPNTNKPVPEEDIAANIVIGNIDGFKLKPDDVNPTYQINIIRGS